MDQLRQISLTMMALLSLIAGTALAQTEPAKPKPTKKTEKKAEKQAAKTPITPARESELLIFVRENHPELAELLDQLKPMKVSEYEAALKDLDRDARRLDQLQRKTPNRYEPELNLWKSRSRIRLLSAQWAISQDTQLREELKDELRQQMLLQIKLWELEIEAAEQTIEKQQRRVEELKKQSHELHANSDKWIENKLSALEREQQKDANVKKKNPTRAKSKPTTALKTDTKADLKSETSKGPE